MTTYYYADNITNFYQLFHYTDYASGGVFGLCLLIMVFFICFISMRNSMGNVPGMTAKIFSASAFVTAIASVMLFMLGAVNDLTMYICIIATAVSVFGNVMSGNY